MRALSTEMIFDALAIRMDSTRVEGIAFVANITHPDTGEELIVELSNATLTTQAGFQSNDPDVTVTIDRSDFEDVIIGTATFIDQIATGVAKVEGDVTGIQAMFGALVEFDLLFELLPGTAPID
jgi:alkyl sulfatase BDS1-like metallo-beta-lactamase superfamily hydrolase